MRRLFTSVSIAFMLLASAGAGCGFTASGADTRMTGIAAEQPVVKTVASGIELSATSSADCHFAIYSITGQLVKTVDVTASTHITVDLPQGYYIVKCNAWAKKIVVR